MTSNNTLNIFVLYSLLVLFHLIPSLDQATPYVTPDEMSYLAQAKYFSGKDEYPNAYQFFLSAKKEAGIDVNKLRKTWPYYSFGYSLIVAPAYWISNTLKSEHKGVMALNSLMLSTLFPIIFFFLKGLYEVDDNVAASVAFITSLYPPYILQAHIGWAENALIPGFALSCLLFVHYLKKRNVYSVLPFAIVTGYLYAIHPRALAAVIAALACLIAIAIASRGRQRESAIVGIFILTGVTVTISCVVDDIASLMGAVTQGTRARLRLFSFFDRSLISEFIGNLAYLTLATIGVFLLGLAESIRSVFASKRLNLLETFRDTKSGLMLYLALASLLMFGASVFFLSKTQNYIHYAGNTDLLLYGRYNEGFLSLYIALGLLGIYRSRKDSDERYQYGLHLGYGIVLLSGIAFSVFMSDFTYLRSVHTYGIFPWQFLSMSLDGWLRIAPIVFAPLLWMWIALKAFLQNKNKGLFVVGGYFFLLDLSLIIYVRQIGNY
jgi:hypothetical protein